MIGFYHPYDPYGCFSNWYPAEFDYAGKHYANSEQYMMYQKVAMFSREDFADQIMQTSDPGTCKTIAGQPFDEFDPNVWERTCYTVVKRGVKAKFAQNADILKTLLDTGTELLAECSARDRIWGIGIDISDPDRTNVTKWKGQNLLGRILMEVREELRQELRLSEDGSLHYVEANDLEPLPEWKMTAGFLRRQPQYYKATHAYSDTLGSYRDREAFYNGRALCDWEAAIRADAGKSLPAAGFFEMKQDIYDTARRSRSAYDKIK